MNTHTSGNRFFNPLDLGMEMSFRCNDCKEIQSRGNFAVSEMDDSSVFTLHLEERNCCGEITKIPVLFKDLENAELFCATEHDTEEYQGMFFKEAPSTARN